MYMQSVPNDVDRFGARNLLNYNARGPFGDTPCKNCAAEYKLGSHQLTRLTRRFGLVLTWGGLKGGDG